MTDLTSVDEVRLLQSSMRAVFDTPNGKTVLSFLEELCGWYDFNDEDPNRILIKHGGRRALATIKTFLRLNPEQIVALTKEQVDG